MPNVVHHIELWTSDVVAATPSFDWVLTSMGWRADHDPEWSQGRMTMSTRSGPMVTA